MTTTLDALPDLSCVGILRRLSRPAAKNHYVGFDTEDDGKGRVISCAFYDGKDFFYTRDPDEAITYILNYPVPAVFAAHNLEYDLGNLFKGCNYIYIDEIIKTGRVIYATLKMSKHVFINSGSFFPGSLLKMGKLIGLPKLEGDPFNPEYNKRDAEIVQVFLSRFQDRVLSEFGVTVKSTIGQLAMTVFRTRYMDTDRVITFNHADCLKAYYGGRVEVYYKGVVKDVIAADINSCYPFVMSRFPYPDTERISVSRIDTHEHGIGEFTVEVPADCFLPPLPWRSPETGRLFFPVGRFTGWWTYAEIRNALSAGVKILEEKPGYGSNVSCHPFVRFVDDLYGKRELAKDRLDRDPDDHEAAFDSYLYKLVGNNLYGKFSQHHPKAVLSRSRWGEAKRARLHVIDEDVVGPFYSYRLKMTEAPATANFMWGIHVTSYARIYLWQQARRVLEAGGTLLYADTDCVMFTGKSPFAGGNQLGALKEERYDLGVFRQSKGYLLCNRRPDGRYGVIKSACKGVPQAYALDFITRGMASFTRPFRLREGLISASAVKSKFMGEVGVNVWHDVSKEMQSVYIKRRGDPQVARTDGVQHPVNVNDIPDLEKNCFQPAHSIACEIKNLGIELMDKPRNVSVFANVKIPENWHKNSEKIVVPEKLQSGVLKLHWLSMGELHGLTPGSTWFAGEVLSHETDKKGKIYYKIQIMEYLGQILTHRNFYAALPVGLIPEVEKLGDKILKKKIAVRMSDTYILDSLFLELEIL